MQCIQRCQFNKCFLRVFLRGAIAATSDVSVMSSTRHRHLKLVIVSYLLISLKWSFHSTWSHSHWNSTRMRCAM